MARRRGHCRCFRKTVSRGCWAVDTCPADTEPARDRRRAKFFLAAQPLDLDRIDRRLAALIDAARLGGIDPFQLALASQIGLELGEHPEHVEECLAGTSAGIDRLLGRPQGDVLGPEFVDDVLEVAQRAGQTVDAGRVSSSRRKSSIVSSSVRPSLRAPLAFSARITSQPAAFSAARWIDRSWSRVETWA